MKYFSSVSGKSLKFFSVTSELFVVVFFVSIVEVLVVVFYFDSLGPHPTKPDKSTAAHKPDNSFLFIISPPNIL